MIRLRGWHPAHGWKPFVTELVVVVLGVLIALGAQQAVDSWNTSRKLADFRAAVDSEIADNLTSYEGRIQQSACLGRRLDELERWQADWRDGDGPAVVGTIGRPLAFRAGSSVWESGAADLAASMPLKERLAYARIYDGLATYASLAQREVEAWHGLYGYDGAERLSPQEVNALRGFILAARSTDDSLQSNFPSLRERARADLGIVTRPYPDGRDFDLCPPLQFRS